jgi:hypothetical protein
MLLQITKIGYEARLIFHKIMRRLLYRANFSQGADKSSHSSITASHWNLLLKHLGPSMHIHESRDLTLSQ